MAYPTKIHKAKHFSEKRKDPLSTGYDKLVQVYGKGTVDGAIRSAKLLLSSGGGEDEEPYLINKVDDE